MRLTRSELKQIAGELWANGEFYGADGVPLLRKFQQSIKTVGPKLHDSTELELDEKETATVNVIKAKLNIK